MSKHAHVTVFFLVFALCAGSSFASAGDVPDYAQYHGDSFGGLRLMAQAETGPDDYFFPDDPEDNLDKYHIADPLRPFNIVMYHFNDKLYFYALKPVARGWRAVVPETARTGVKNFFHNLAAPIRFVNALLQLKGEKAVAELGGFMLNSTFGVLGFGNLAKDVEGLEPAPEDLGQTFGHYGVGHGLYLVLPVFGPSSARDAVGLVGDSFLDPVGYVDPWELETGLRITDAVNKTSFRIGDYEALKEAALEPYDALKNAYLQRRTKSVNN